jgi:hypothetical protein
MGTYHGLSARQAVKRNPERFPADFMFQLSAREFENWRSQLVMSKPGAKNGAAPRAFRVHGARRASVRRPLARASTRAGARNGDMLPHYAVFG